MSQRVYLIEEKVGSVWLFAPPPIAKQFTQREQAERYVTETLVPAYPERRFRPVVLWGTK
jgi:hypothetical protein